MRLLDRYLLRELLIPLAFCLGGFLIFWISFNLFSELGRLQDFHLRPGDVAMYYLARIPEFLVVVLPIGILLAMLYTLTNHARHNELTAIRAAGVSLWRLSAPYLAVGFVASLAMFAVNELWSPRSTAAAEQILHRRKAQAKSSVGQWKRVPLPNSRDGRFWMFDYDMERQEMKNVQVDSPLPGGATRVFAADRGVRSNGMWVFFNVKEQTDVPGKIFPENRVLTNRMAKPEFTETPEIIKSEINIQEHLKNWKTDKTEIPLADIFRTLRLRPDLKGQDRARLFTKMHGRLAAPWMCLVVVLIAIPFGAASGRRNAFTGVAGSVFICFTYFVLLQLGLAVGAGGYLPPWLAAWFPNLFFGITALLLIYRVR